MLNRNANIRQIANGFVVQLYAYESNGFDQDNNVNIEKFVPTVDEVGAVLANHFTVTA